MFTCILVDDQPEVVALFSSYIEKSPFLTLLKVYADPFKALANYHTDRIDMLLLGREMKGLSGNEFVKKLKENLSGALPYVLFISRTLFPVSAGYLMEEGEQVLASASYQEFEAALKRILDYGKVSMAGLEEMDFFFADTSGKKVKVNFSDIYYVEAAGNYVTLVTRTGRLTIYKSMHELEALLPANYFLRIHKSYITSLGCIHAITRTEMILQVEGKIINFPIGITYKNNLLKKLKLE